MIELLVTIDTEPDCDTHWNRSNPLTFTSVTHGIPDLLRPIWDQHNIRPIYFVSPEVVMNDECVSVLRAEHEKGAIIGAHLHSEYIEPNVTIHNPAGRPSLEYPCFAHSTEVEYEKIKNLTELIEKKIGERPIWYRAARYGADLDTIRSLKKLGYKYDSSVTPCINWSSQGGPDHSKAPVQPYYIADNDYYSPASSAEHGAIKEYPITISGKRFGFLSKLLPDKWLFYSWLRPTHMSVFEQKKIIDDFEKRFNGQDDVVFVVMFHSMEIIPKASPFVRSWTGSKQLVKRLDHVISYIKK